MKPPGNRVEGLADGTARVRRGVDSLSKKDGKKLLSVSQMRNNTIIDCSWFRTDVEVETRML